MSNAFDKLLNKPVFFIGMPRSGTTVVFEAFAKSSSLGWLSNYSEMWPQWPFVNLLCPLLDNSFLNLRGNKKQYGNVVFGNRYLPQPVEAYNFWDLYSERNFSRDYMLNLKADDEECNRIRKAVKKVLRYQMKKQLVTKLTGPGRISYLSSIFPDATFIHVVRDGRAVVQSLMNVGFWKEKGGFDAPFWEGGLNDQDLAEWNEGDKDPAVLCALQWGRVIQTIHQEQSLLERNNCLTVRYEDYIANPKKELLRLSDSVSCQFREDEVATIGDSASIVNMNDKYKETFKEDTINKITNIMRPMLIEYNYEV